MALNVSGTGSDADGKSMAALGAQQAAADHESAKDDGWEYDSDEMKKKIGDLRELRHGKLAELLNLANDLTDIEAPGNEQVSDVFAQYASASGRKYRDTLRSSDEFLDSYVQKLIEIDKEYRKSDDNAAESVESLEA